MIRVAATSGACRLVRLRKARWASRAARDYMNMSARPPLRLGCASAAWATTGATIGWRAHIGELPAASRQADASHHAYEQCQRHAIDTAHRIEPGTWATRSPSAKVGETADGVIVRGARVLATLAPVADEQTVDPGQLVARRRDAVRRWLSPISVDTPGARNSCVATRPRRRAPFPFGKPLSCRYDAQPCHVAASTTCRSLGSAVLHRWRRPDLQLDARDRLRRISMTTQSTIRALTKLEFTYGLATRMAELIGDASPVRRRAESLLAYVRLTANALELSLEQAWERADGVWFPNERSSRCGQCSPCGCRVWPRSSR